MAEIFCPMCGKPNPSDREVCQFCEARLVPLIAETPPQAEASSQSEEIPSLENEAASEEAISEQEESSSDWLTNLRDEDSAPHDEGEEEIALEADSAFEDEEASDWLSRLDEDAGEGEESESEDVDADFDGQEASEWLSRLEGSSQEEEDLPDWLRENALQDEELPTQSEEEEEIPDWLRDQPEETVSDTETPPEWSSQVAGESGKTAVSEEELPDWLAEVPEEGISEQIEEPTSPRDELVAEPSSEEEIQVPDWLSEMQEDEEPLPKSVSSDEPIELDDFDFESMELASASEEFEQQAISFESHEEEAASLEPTEEMEEEEPEKSYSLDLPSEWFPEEFSEEEPTGETEADPEISLAEIPSWLESMRPVEDAAPSVSEEEEQPVESAGPLAGLRGVLSAEPDVTRVQKPPTYSVKLHVTESQNAHADLLREMLAEEGQPQPISRQAMISPQHLLRAAIGLTLILTVLWQILTGMQQSPLPTFSPETAAVNRIIGGLPDQARVMVSFDYEPGLIGEMDAAASAVVDHLLLRGAYLTLVSTSPMGPIVAERFLLTAQVEHNYTNLEQYANLGYIPGGPAGLLSFAETPQRILPYTIDGRPAWDAGLPPLQGVDRLADYALVMVITDDPITARAWIEQVQPYLETGDTQTPLVMVTSAQAEPLVRPYYQPTSGQVQGLVSGLRDGGAYALLTGRGGLVRKYWDAFSLGLWVAGALVVLGGVINIALVLLERRKNS